MFIHLPHTATSRARYVFHCIYTSILTILKVHYSGFGLSQAPPHLPPPPASPSHTELEETDINSAAAPDPVIAPQDIDLEFN
jgi:hypothetical protein